MDPPSPHATTLSRTLVRSKSCSSSWPPKGLGCRTQPDPGQRLTAKSSRHSASVATSVPALAHSLVRSEEHTSELQSLMRISYAVFCLKKKITKLTYEVEDH